MAYKVNYDSLDAMCDNVTQQVSAWSEELQQLSSACEVLVNSSNMSGNGADAIRDYVSNVHKLMQGLLGEVLSLHASNCLLYFDDYQYTVDSGLHTRIEANELERLKEELKITQRRATDIDDELAFQLGKISDIFSVNYMDASETEEAHQYAIDHLTKLDENIRSVEQAHLANDFVSTSELITALTAFIQEYLNMPRGKQTDFTMATLAGSQALAALYAAHLSVSDELSKKENLVEGAIQRQQERDEQLFIERQKEVEKQKKYLAVACVVLSVAAFAVIAVSGGTATPLVVGAVSGVVGAVNAAGNSALDQYAQTGNWDNLNWGQIGKEAVIGGVVGFATGYVSAGVSGAITNSASSTVVGKALLGSSNTAVRIGTAATIGGISEVAGGIASRGTETLIRTGDVGEALEDAFDGKQMAIDATIGTVSGGYGEYKKTKAEYVDWNNTSNSNEEIEIMKEMEANGEFEIDGYDYGPTEIDPNATGPADPSRRLATEKTGTIIGDRDSGTFDFVPDNEAARETMAKYGQESIHYENNFAEFDPYTKHQTEWGEVDCEVKVGYMSGERAANYAQADEALAKKITEQTGVPVTKTEAAKFRESNQLTWHEVQDRETMQLVPREIHESARHRGGVSQAKYEMAWGDISIDDGFELNPRADAKWDMGDNIIKAVEETVKEVPKVYVPEYKKTSLDLDQLFEKLGDLTIGEGKKTFA